MDKRKKFIIRLIIFIVILIAFYLIAGKDNIYFPFIIYTVLCVIMDAISGSENHNKHIYDNDLDFDEMDGQDFEYWCADLLKREGYTNIEVTQASKDQGADILAMYDGMSYAIQCKRYAKPVGLSLIHI